MNTSQVYKDLTYTIFAQSQMFLVSSVTMKTVYVEDA